MILFLKKVEIYYVRILQNAYFLAKIGADTAENEQHFAEICQKLATTRPGPDAWCKYEDMRSAGEVRGGGG